MSDSRDTLIDLFAQRYAWLTREDVGSALDALRNFLAPASPPVAKSLYVESLEAMCRKMEIDLKAATDALLEAESTGFRVARNALARAHVGGHVWLTTHEASMLADPELRKSETKET